MPSASQSAMPETLAKATSENPAKQDAPLSWDTFWKLLESKFTSLGIPGIFLVMAVNQIKDDSSNWPKILLWFGLAVVSWLVIEILKRLRPYVEKSLDWCFDQLGKLLLAVTDRFQSHYYERLVFDCREYEGRGFNAGALSLEDVYVPLKLVERSSRTIQQNIVDPRRLIQGQQGIDNLISKLSSKSTVCKRLVILGAPGSGKSTLLRHLTLMYALRRHGKVGQGVPKLIPVLLRLRDVYQEILDQPDLSLQEIIENSVKKLQQTDPLHVRPNWFAKRLGQGKCLVMLDGLDEIPEDSDRAKISQWVDKQLGLYCEAKFILTSRPDAYRRAPLRANVIESEVQPLSRSERDRFIRNWCRNWHRSDMGRRLAIKKRLDAGDRDRVEQDASGLISQIDAIAVLQLMAANPLLLVLMAKTYSEKGALSKRRVDIYKDVCQVLLEGRSRLISGQAKSNRISADAKQKVLQGLAWRMMQQEELQFTLTKVKSRVPVFSEAASVLDSRLARVPNNRLSAIDFITKDEVGVRELISDRQQEGIYEFAHRTFQEYLAAVEIKSLDNPEQIFLDLFQQGDAAISWWRETILFYAAQADSTPILKSALASPSIVALSLAYECLGVTEDVDPLVRTQLEEVINKNLMSDLRADFVFAASILLDMRIQRINPGYNNEIEADQHPVGEIYDEKPLTIAEYRLALYETTMACDHYVETTKSPLNPYCHPDREAVNRYCAWLMRKTQAKYLKQEVCYRPIWDDSGSLHLIRFLVPERYYQLAQLLFAGEWEAADRETYRLMITTVGKGAGELFDRADLENFPCADLLAIDKLWVKASNGHFGFSVQKKIWEECGSPMSCSDDWEKFGDRVGWRRDGDWLSYSDFHQNPSLSPVGELPVVYLWVFGFLGWRRCVSVVSLFSRKDL
jgi:energy-coupling factor transporter ATP-binding protein EcfA2